jgi:hypothetical protein
MKFIDSEVRQETVAEFQKSQAVRLVDVFLIGPVCIYAGVKYYNTLPKWLGVSLITIGAATVIYNSRNYLINQRGQVIK